MPYIKQEERPLCKPEAPSALTVGQLNYQITLLCNEWLANNGVKYGSINDVIGVLECAKLEFYRRVAAPYEDMKIKENGDVYE